MRDKKVLLRKVRADITKLIREHAQLIALWHEQNNKSLHQGDDGQVAGGVK